MLKITIPSRTFFNEETQEIFNTKEQELQLEHSLVSISKWEAKYHKPFLTSKDEKSDSETLDYVRFMTITQNVDPLVYHAITKDVMDSISKYIDDSMTATTISREKSVRNRDIVTSEIIYYWMINFNIPFECQKWHLNRLMTLIEVCNVRNQSTKKLNPKERAARNRALNEARKAKYNTAG